MDFLFMSLAKRKCVPCAAGTPPMPLEETSIYLKQLDNWVLSDNNIEKNFKFRDFQQAMKFVNKVAGIAEDEGHHPDILIHNWNRVRLTLSTHAIKGLSENDFILAAKIDQIS